MAQRESIEFENEYLFKILVIGDLATGKTCLIRKYVQNIFWKDSKPTIGADFAIKNMKWNQDTLVRLQLWDIAGQERFGNLTHVYYREAVAAVVVFDVSRPQTFEGTMKWKNDLDSKVRVTLSDGSQIRLPTILLANKCDTLENGAWPIRIPKNEMDDYCRKNGFLGWHEVSAKEDSYLPNIDSAFRGLVKEVIATETRQCSPDINLTPISLNPLPGSKADRCSC
eukprot:TRINITY_DN1291_c0_g1_i1.p1 TRINITY_DN1291_c0_g1~~TRINITY_DN1291_c0_g1_i1.p1  ORF type:complete len:225 (+),score=31.64 TRINITY_DN1291_c0_g1_i1:84-758(+)